MNKRYQVFVSSTYADLKEERSKVIQTLMEMDCIPSGMELFPAIDEEQFEFIKKVIDDCDYYILIIGGRYGSLSNDGISYTEKEYEYAINSGIKVLAFLHKNPDEIPLGKSDIDPALREKLKLFREKVADGRLVKFWEKSEDLPGLLSLSLTKTIKTYPAIGWTRVQESSNEDLLLELNDLRKENKTTSDQLNKLKKEQNTSIENIAALDEKFTVKGKKWNDYSRHYDTWELSISWSKLFEVLSPFLLEYPSDDNVKSKLGDLLYEVKTKAVTSAHINEQDFQTVKVQFTSLGLVNVKYTKTTSGGMSLFWFITEKGKKLMYELRTVKSKK